MNPRRTGRERVSLMTEGNWKIGGRQPLPTRAIDLRARSKDPAGATIRSPLPVPGLRLYGAGQIAQLGGVLGANKYCACRAFCSVIMAAHGPYLCWFAVYFAG